MEIGFKRAVQKTSQALRERANFQETDQTEGQDERMSAQCDEEDGDDEGDDHYDDGDSGMTEES